MPVAIKSVKQVWIPTPQLLEMMEIFRKMVNDCLRIGLSNDVSTMKQLCSLAYRQLADYDIVTYYKLCAISHAAGILANRKKSIKRGLQSRQPYAKRSFLVSCYGFKIVDNILKVPIGHKQYFDITLNNHTKTILSGSGLKIRSFTITPDSVSICYSKDVEVYKLTAVIGVDRNLANVTVGNTAGIVQYDLSKIVDIAESNRSVIRAFRRKDDRVLTQLAMKHGRRRKNRIHQLLHKVSKHVIQRAKQQNAAIIFEDIRHIRRMYQRGNYQGCNYHAKMNSWPYHELKHQIEYKAAWEGVPIIQLSVTETRGTSQLCPRCGKKITQVDRKTRQLWCAYCKKWMDRDVVATMNISIKGRAFLSKNGEDVFERPQGLAGEAMKGNPTTPVILRVDASKLGFRYKPKIR